MRRGTQPLIWLPLLLLGAALAWSEEPGGSDLVVHEWGVITCVRAADGTLLSGVHREEPDLPEFVVPRGGRWSPVWYGLRDSLRSEGVQHLPITHRLDGGWTTFHSPRTQSVRVRAKLPHGWFSAWWPAVQGSEPAPGALTGAPVQGVLDWGVIEVTPASADAGAEPGSALPDGHPWRGLRPIEANVVRTGGAAERFLYRRGLADVPAALSASVGEDLQVTLRNDTTEPLGPIVLGFVPGVDLGGSHRVDLFGAGAAFIPVERLGPGESRTIALRPECAKETRPLREVAADAGGSVERLLAEAGLTASEARALRRQAHAELFFTPGLRALFVWPGALVDAHLTLEVAPPVREIRRAFLGCVELLDPERERAVEQTLGAYIDSRRTDPYGMLEVHRLALLREGRLLEPVLRAVAAGTKREDVAALARKIVKALNSPQAEEAPVLGPDQVGGPPEAAADPARMTPAQRGERIAAVTAWLEKWEPYAAKTHCDATGVADARLELALLRWVEAQHQAGVALEQLDLPRAWRVLPLKPATCGCSAARRTGASPRD